MTAAEIRAEIARLLALPQTRRTREQIDDLVWEQGHQTMAALRDARPTTH